eukprot:5910056-Ditylum_brightwellii.AAC.1
MTKGNRHNGGNDINKQQIFHPKPKTYGEEDQGGSTLTLMQIDNSREEMKRMENQLHEDMK